MDVIKTSKEKFKSVEKKLRQINEEYKNKYKELDQIKKKQKIMKKDYNTLIKSFNKMTRDLINYEKSLEELEKKKNKNKKHQKLIFYKVNPEFVEKFNHNISQLNKDIRRFILMCFGFALANLSTITNCFSNEIELRAMLKNQDQIIQLLNTDKTIDKEFQILKANFHDINLVHPFNIILDFINLSVDTIRNEDQSKEIRVKHEELLKKEHELFLSLKTLEGEIVKLENSSIGLLKYLKAVKNLNERFGQIQRNENEDKKAHHVDEINRYLNDFSSSLNKVKEKPEQQNKENLNCITLRSEYSDDLNEFMRENNMKNKIKTNKIKLIDLNFERSRTFTPKLERNKNRSKYESKTIIDSSLFMDMHTTKFEKTMVTKSLTKSVIVKENNNLLHEEIGSNQQRMSKSQVGTGFETGVGVKPVIVLDDENLDDDMIPKENETYQINNNKIYSSNSVVNLTFENRLFQFKSLEDQKNTRLKNVKGVKLITKKNLPDPKITISYLEKSNTKPIEVISKVRLSPTNSLLLSVNKNIDKDLELENTKSKEDWAISVTGNKLITRTAKLAENASRKHNKSMPSFSSSLKIDSGVKSQGCCVSCV